MVAREPERRRRRHRRRRTRRHAQARRGLARRASRPRSRRARPARQQAHEQSSWPGVVRAARPARRAREAGGRCRARQHPARRRRRGDRAQARGPGAASPLERAHGGRRLDAERLDQPRARRGRPQRLDLPARAIQGEHEQGCGAARGPGARRRPSSSGTIRDGRPSASSASRRRSSAAQPQLLQARDRRRCERLGGQVGQRVAAPQCERLVERGDRGLRLAAGPRRRSRGGQARSAGGPARPGSRARRSRAPGSRSPSPSAAQLRDLTVDLRHRCRGRCSPVELVRQAIDRHDAVRRERQDRQHRAAPRPAEYDRRVLADDLELAEDADVEAHCWVTGSGWIGER